MGAWIVSQLVQGKNNPNGTPAKFRVRSGGKKNERLDVWTFGCSATQMRVLGGNMWTSYALCETALKMTQECVLFWCLGGLMAKPRLFEVRIVCRRV